MPDGRSQRPLFELLQSQPTRTAPSPPPEHDEQPPPPEHARESGSRTVAVPLPALYAAGSLILLLLVVAFIIGFQVGTSRGDPPGQPLSPTSRQDATEPAQNAGEAGARLSTQSDRGPGHSTGHATRTPAPERDNQDAVILSAAGPLDADPRETGRNYLELAVLRPDAAREALGFLDRSGVEAIGVRIPAGARGGGQYRIVSLELSVPGDAYSRLRDERDAHVRGIRQIGRRWAEAGGASDFSDPLWRRYDG